MENSEEVFQLSSYYYDLPERLIAQSPLSKRDASKMMVLQKGKEIQHRFISDITDYLKVGDCLVVNNTRVIPARLFGRVEGYESACEILLLKRIDQYRWECIGKPGKRLKVGNKLLFIRNKLSAVVESILPDGGRVIRFEFVGVWEEVLSEAGNVPLPPYIHKQLEDPERYQTVYAKEEGSAAAPTAGLHFTPELLNHIKEAGVEIAELTLHVGLGTFRPVREENLLDHKMHSEEYVVSEECAEKVNRAKQSGGRIISVGTTSCRCLETATDPESGLLKSGRGSTEIFIYPGYQFKIMDALLTNFHLPESTLLMLVSAFYGREEMLEAYRAAVAEEYRFFSFGDCMLIFPRGEA